MSLSDLINQLVDIRNQRTELSKQDKTLTEKASKLESDIMHAMNEVGTFRASSDFGHSVSMVKKVHPTVVNWDDFYTYLITTRNFDLLQKRLSSPAFRDRWDQGECIPGASSSEVWELSTTQSRK
jgi:hypothetical protein